MSYAAQHSSQYNFCVHVSLDVFCSTIPSGKNPNALLVICLCRLICMQYVTGATCGDYNGVAASTLVFTDAMCGLNKAYDSTKSTASIAGNNESAAINTCCKVRTLADSHR